MSQAKFERIILVFVFFHVLLGVYLSFANLRYFEGSYVLEDGFIEWLTADALLAGMVLCFLRALKFFPRKGVLFLIMSIFYALLFLFGAGEELSWAQRIVGYKAPLYFILNNSQSEMNIHNLVVNGIKVNKIIFGTLLGIVVACYFVTLPILYRFSEKIKMLIDKIGLPLPRILHLMAYLVLGLLVALCPSGKRGELLEFGGVWIFFLMFLYPYNKSTFA